MNRSIEETILNLKKYIELDEIYTRYKNRECTELNNFEIFCIKHCEDIETVLGNLEALSNMQIAADKELKKAKQINEEHEKINGGLREKVKELEEERQLVGIPVRNKRDGTIGIVLHQWKSGSIAVLENINPRVINTHDSWSTLEIITDEIKQTKTKDDSISKQINEEHKKINGELREKIKELEAKLEFKEWGDLDDLKFEEYIEEILQEREDK